MLGYNIPKTSVTLMTAVYRKVFPAVNQELTFWEKRARQIPDEELRTQALASIESKRFHCLGGAVFALLAGFRWRNAVRFIVAYQTISDYLDNLCDRSTSMDPDDFSLLHGAMVDALSPGNSMKNYYALREETSDGEYLSDLVRTCQNTVRKLDSYGFIQDYLLKLENLYGDLQVHKHVRLDKRIPRLTGWFEVNKEDSSQLAWYEFSAAAGSTLGIFCLVSYALGENMSRGLAENIYQSYFPFMQGLHILLDYYIDQEEDREEKDLNFCSYYENQEIMTERFSYFIEQADHAIQALPDSNFHKMICQGLIGLYLGDPKVKKITNGMEMKDELLRVSGSNARFFHWNTQLYHKVMKTRG